MVRDIILIDEEKCNGCGLCVPNCPEGAIQIIDEKARLVSDLFCDGLGACLGHCPEGAITVEKREAEPYDERRVMENIARQGHNVIKAHLSHLKEHGEDGYLQEALAYLEEQGIDVDLQESPAHQHAGCPGARAMTMSERESTPADSGESRPSELRHWPIQLHLIPASAPHFRDVDLLLSADCVAYAVGDFHRDFLRGKTLAIACPKLDDGQDVYLKKLTALVDFAGIRSLTVAMMEVPCCQGLIHLAQRAVAQAKRDIPVSSLVVSVEGKVLQETRV